VTAVALVEGRARSTPPTPEMCLCRLNYDARGDGDEIEHSFEPIFYTKVCVLVRCFEI